MSKRFARIENGVVLEIIILDVAPEDAFHPGIAATLKECAAQVEPNWLLKGNKFEAPAVVVPTLEAIKAALKVTVDTTAEAERKKYITPGEGQAMTYQRKVEEAARAILEEEPTAANYPMLAASLGVDGETVKDVATIVLAMDAGWAAIGAGIEKIRMNAKKAIDEAASAEAASAIVDAIVWPEGAAA